jgi:hypothetical protein
MRFRLVAGYSNLNIVIRISEYFTCIVWRFALSDCISMGLNHKKTPGKICREPIIILMDFINGLPPVSESV